MRHHHLSIPLVPLHFAVFPGTPYSTQLLRFSATYMVPRLYCPSTSSHTFVSNTFPIRLYHSIFLRFRQLSTLNNLSSNLVQQNGLHDEERRPLHVQSFFLDTWHSSILHEHHRGVPHALPLVYLTSSTSDSNANHRVTPAPMPFPGCSVRRLHVTLHNISCISYLCGPLQFHPTGVIFVWCMNRAGGLRVWSLVLVFCQL